MKLTIKKQTIANLDASDMTQAKGGVKILLTITPTICKDLCFPEEELDYAKN